jgi:hypothetical protein
VSDRKKKPTSKPKDQHKSGFMVRLPESFRPPLEVLKAKNRRPTTTEIQIALERHFRAEGVLIPDSST